MPRLRRVDPRSPGITRRRRGRGFSYETPAGERLEDTDALERIEELTIPPAWKDVWICPIPNGHIQAVGVDQAGRRQYLYHPMWRRQRDLEKFDRVLDFARRLPCVRERVFADLHTRGLTHDRVLACAVRLLDLGFFRVGGEEYAESNGSYGLATMLREHVRIEHGNTVTFEYTAKSGKHRVQSVADESVVAVIRALVRRKGGGDELLAYRRRDRAWADVRSNDINEHLRELAGIEVSAKDFRTWNATVLAAVALAVSAEARSESAQKRAVARAVKEVSEYLGNTPTVCRSSYIDPRVIECYHHGRSIADDLSKLGRDTEVGSLATQGAIERAVLDLLSKP